MVSAFGIKKVKKTTNIAMGSTKAVMLDRQSKDDFEIEYRERKRERYKTVELKVKTENESKK